MQLLEEELDKAEKDLKETTEKLRQVDVKAEHFERAVARAEQERDEWEKKCLVSGGALGVYLMCSGLPDVLGFT